MRLGFQSNGQKTQLVKPDIRISGNNYMAEASTHHLYPSYNMSTQILERYPFRWGPALQLVKESSEPPHCALGILYYDDVHI